MYDMQPIGSQSQRFAQATVANTDTGNVLAGTQYEYVKVASVISLYAAEDVGDVTAELVLGQRRVLPSSPVPMAPGGIAGTGPNNNENQIAQTIVSPQERIQLSFTGGAAASSVRFLVVVDPVPPSMGGMV